MEKKLTEAQLRNAIMESVRNTLSELDWKTYSNAAGKLYGKAREGFGKYSPTNEIPHDSEHGKLFRRAERLQRKANDERRKMYGDKSEEEFQNFANNRYNYKKGEGWKLDEDLEEGGYPNQRLREQWVNAMDLLSSVDELSEIVYNNISVEQMRAIISDINDSFSVNADNALDYEDEIDEGGAVELSEDNLREIIANGVRKSLENGYGISDHINTGEQKFSEEK